MTPTRGLDCQAKAGNVFELRFVLDIKVILSPRVNVHTAGAMGEFEVVGCEGTSPTLVLTRGQTYTLLQVCHNCWKVRPPQEDPSNWLHPLGLAYGPPGLNTVHSHGGHGDMASGTGTSMPMTPMNMTSMPMTHMNMTNMTMTHMNMTMTHMPMTNMTSTDQIAPELSVPTPHSCDLPEHLCNPGEQVRRIKEADYILLGYLQVQQAPLYGIDGVFETLDNWNNATIGGRDVYLAAFQVLRNMTITLFPGAPKPMESTQIRNELYCSS